MLSFLSFLHICIYCWEVYCLHALLPLNRRSRTSLIPYIQTNYVMNMSYSSMFLLHLLEIYIIHIFNRANCISILHFLYFWDIIWASYKGVLWAHLPLGVTLESSPGQLREKRLSDNLCSHGCFMLQYSPLQQGAATLDGCLSQPEDVV